MLSGVVLFVILILGSPLPALADDAPADAPTQETYGEHLLDRKDDLTPFLKQHTDEFYRVGFYNFLYVFANVLAMNLVVGWIFDVITCYYFSRFSRHVAPAHAKINNALLYATGHLVLLAIFGVFFFLFSFSIGLTMPWTVYIILSILLFICAYIIQTIWVSFNYQVSTSVSTQFYLAIFIAHAIGLVVCFPIIKVRTVSMISEFVDQVITPQLQIYVADRKLVLTNAEAARDKVHGEISVAQDRITQAMARQADLRKQIEDKKASEFYVFNLVVHLHAEGELTEARDQLNAFLVKFPNGALLESAKTQLTQVEGELATQEAQRQAALAAAAQAAAQARADFLARASRGEITLSEMHQALQGKTLAEVTDLFGKPAVTEAGRWGYPQKMIVNPLTHEKYGLTVYFADGVTQSVDYYYGGQ